MILVAKAHGHRFKICGKVELFGYVKSAIFVLDTGCCTSVVNFQKLFDPEKYNALEYKQTAIDEGRDFELGFGISDNNETVTKQKALIKNKKYLECTAIKFLYQNCNIELGRHCSMSKDAHVNFDRTTDNLIGMDILKDFDFHCGWSLKTGEYMFVGCPKDDISPEYINALYDHFNIRYVKKEEKEANFIAAALRKFYKDKSETI